MFEIIISVSLYLGAIVLLVNGAIVFCDITTDENHIVTEP